MRWLCFCQLWLACVAWCLAQLLTVVSAWQPGTSPVLLASSPDTAPMTSAAQALPGVSPSTGLSVNPPSTTTSLLSSICAHNVPTASILFPLVSGPSISGAISHASSPLQVQPGDVVINEVAWSGTAARTSDEWLELANTTRQPIPLTDWSLVALDGTPAISLAGTIQPSGYYLLERNHDLVVSDVIADLIYPGELNDASEQLQLLDATGSVIDTANIGGGPWPAGGGAPDHPTMERINPLAPDAPDSWANHLGDIRNGHDRSGNPINGTPRRPNSTTYPVRPGDVIINEVAWSGTQASSTDEWIELFNRRSFAIDLSGWQLLMDSGVPLITLQGALTANGFYLIERNDDNTVAGVSANLTAAFATELADQGGSLRLVTGTLTVDTANADGGPWPAGSATPGFRSMERLAPELPDTDANWSSNDAFHRNGQDRAGQPINGTPGTANSSTMPPAVLISELLYVGTVPNTQGDEFVELCNAQPGPVRLDGLKIGDEETRGGDEGMYRLPAGYRLGPSECLVIARNAAQFASRFGFYPDFELVVGGANYLDTPEVPQLERYPAWAGGNWALADAGDEVLLLGPADQRLDGVAYGQGDYPAVGVAPAVRAQAPDSLQRVWPFDSDAMAADFLRRVPNPGAITPLPTPPASPPPAADLTGGMHAYWGLLSSHTSYSDGSGPPVWAFASGRASGLHFLAITDQADSLDARRWADIGVQAAAASQPGEFVALRGFEFSLPDQGSVSVWNTSGFISSTDSAYDSLDEFYGWLARQPGVLAGFRPLCPKNGLPALTWDASATLPLCLWQVDSPSNCWRGDLLELSWLRALAIGWRTAPANLGSDAGWGAGSSWRVGLVAPALSQADLLEALRARRAFVTQAAGLAIALRSGNVWMGDNLPCPARLSLTVHLASLDNHSLPITLTVYNGTAPTAATRLDSYPAEWASVVTGQPGHFYWARAVQSDGSLAQTAPLWCTGDAQPETVVLNELLPAPRNVDWDGNGVSDGRDEWIELYNYGSQPVGLGGWQLQDASGASYLLPLGVSLGPRAYALFFRQRTGLTLNNDSDALTLRHLDDTSADTFEYKKGPGYDKALCRLPDGVGNWQGACLPTPGGTNQALPTPTPSAKQASEPVRTDILGARRLTPGAWVKVRGQVTLPPGVLGKRVAYMQDANSGIRLYLPKDHRLTANLGDRIEVTGRLRDVRGEMQITLSKGKDVRPLRPGDPLPPLPINSGVLGEPYEGMLVLLTGRVVTCESGGSFWIDDGSGPVRVYLDPDAHLERPCKGVGQSMQVVGIVSQYRQPHPSHPGYRLLPRYSTDIVSAEAPASDNPPALLPEAGGRVPGFDSSGSSHTITGVQPHKGVDLCAR